LSSSLSDVYEQVTYLQRVLDDRVPLPTAAPQLLVGVRSIERSLSTFLFAAACDLSVALSLRQARPVTGDELDSQDLKASLLVLGATQTMASTVRVIARSWGAPRRMYPIEEVPFPLACEAIRGPIDGGFRAEPDIEAWLSQAPAWFRNRWREDPPTRARYKAALVYQLSRPDEHLRGSPVTPWAHVAPGGPVAVLCIESAVAKRWQDAGNSVVVAILAPYLATLRLATAIHGQAVSRVEELEDVAP